jgi:ankyrin repeat protein
MMAVVRGNAVLVRTLLKEATYQLTIQSQDRYRRTVLQMAVLQQNVDVVRMLLKAKADVNAQDWQGNTALHMVAWMGEIIPQKKLTPILVAAGCRLNSTNAMGDTVLHRAVRLRDLGYAEYLMKTYSKEIHKNIKNKSGETAYQLAEKLGLNEMMKVIR